MRTDFENIKDGMKIRLHPNKTNLLHKKPVIATYSNGYYYCNGSDPTQGPDYYFRDVSLYNDKYEVLT